ncbi:MAG: fimbrial major subunit CsuA/B family protein [Brachymonas sp.]|nr:fimbrial major subunit CsuA/B family protein [Brachymonas sp.]
MKKIALIAALGLMGMGSAMAQTTQVNGTFQVSVNLTSKCLLETAGTTVDFGTYDAFGSASNAAPFTLVSYKCTRGMTPTVKFDVTSGTTSTAGAGATAEGVLSGLLYSLTAALDTTATAGAEPTAGSGGTLGTLGTDQKRIYKVTGAMATGQAGCITAGAGTCAATSHQRTLILEY